MTDLSKLKRIVDIEYNDITMNSSIHHDKLRVPIRDGSIVDIWFSKKMPGSFSYHWERRQIDETIDRHDNFPGPRWKEVATFPKHFHNGSQNRVHESEINNDPASGVREFMDFVRGDAEIKTLHTRTHIFAGKVRNSFLWFASIHKNHIQNVIHQTNPRHQHRKRVYAPRTLATTRSLFPPASTAARSTAAHISS